MGQRKRDSSLGDLCFEEGDLALQRFHHYATRRLSYSHLVIRFGRVYNPASGLDSLETLQSASARMDDARL